ncbi:unnamed protein product [Paramecium octaurelia]|uniref:Uncharacterized protein n=1 Tax=Paramecium octaurelia TaxID=43137 RepID=A0A8S1Y5Q4_PAROT|nr:unnamed protein product [Paramecium octaurelia]
MIILQPFSNYLFVFNIYPLEQRPNFIQQTSQDLIQSIRSFKNRLYYKQISYKRSKRGVFKPKIQAISFSIVLLHQLIEKKVLKLINFRRIQKFNCKPWEETLKQFSGDRNDNQYDVRLFKYELKKKKSGEEQYDLSDVIKLQISFLLKIFQISSKQDVIQIHPQEFYLQKTSTFKFVMFTKQYFILCFHLQSFLLYIQ